MQSNCMSRPRPGDPNELPHNVKMQSKRVSRHPGIPPGGPPGRPKKSPWAILARKWFQTRQNEASGGTSGQGGETLKIQPPARGHPSGQARHGRGQPFWSTFWRDVSSNSLHFTCPGVTFEGMPRAICYFYLAWDRFWTQCLVPFAYFDGPRR